MIEKRLVTFADLEKLTGITYKTLVKRLAEIEPASRSNKEIYFDSVKALAALYAGKKEDLNLVQEKARLSKLQADKIAIELEKMRESLVDKEAFMKGWADKVIACRSKLLNVALQTSGEVAMCEDADLIYRIIADKIEEALHEITV